MTDKNAIYLGMTARQVSNIIGFPYEIFIDQWNRDTGPYLEWKQWVYKSESPVNIAFENPIRDTYLYFNTENLLSGWNISYDKYINVIYNTNEILPDGYTIQLGDTREQVAAKYKAPTRLIPEGWGNTSMPEVWEYHDKYNNLLFTVKFVGGLVISIVNA